MELQLQGESLETLLEQVSTELGPHARITSADRVRRGGVGGFFAKERFEVTVDVDDEDAAAPEEEVTVSTFAELVSQADEGDSGPFVPLDGVAPQPRLSTEGSGFASVLQQLVSDTSTKAAGSLEAARPAPAPAAAPAPRPRPRPELVSPPAERPEAPTAPGEVLVIVGDGIRAIAAAQDQARRLRLDDTAVHLVAPGGLGLGLSGSRLIRSAEEARKRRGSWQGKPHPIVVALDAPLTDAAWAARTLVALHATTVWAVVSATTKTADAQRWLDQIPGVAALMVIDAEASGDPRSVLELGLPIATVDGRPADGPQWRR